MNTELTQLTNSDFQGYAIFDWDSLYTCVTCPNKAAAVALDRARVGGQGLEEFIVVYEIGTMGKYHHTPGERYAREWNWKRAVAELMG